MRQEITRAHKGWALDAVVLDNDITRMMKEDIHTPPNEGVYTDKKGPLSSPQFIPDVLCSN